MSNDRTSPISVPNPEHRQRRGSIADIFSRSSNPSNTQPTNQPTNQQANQRRLSITTLGLSGSPTQPSAFGGDRNFRRGSVSSSMGSNIPTEDSVEDGQGTSPNSQFARRVSFGAQALRDARAGSTGNGRNHPPPSVVARSPPAGSAIISTRSSASISTSPLDERSNASRRPIGEGFNWSEALRSRAERAPSFGGPVSPQAGQRNGYHQRAASIASMEQPGREMPRQPKQNKPDFFQEKILRGDFMD
ncbi:hypothetical protein N7475_008555 [Penicillium sp. IBT 31633x]|nr:hypothetical protein N7475_008555 [Penicillium sp. IBT 31633x]